VRGYDDYSGVVQTRRPPGRYHTSKYSQEDQGKVKAMVELIRYYRRFLQNHSTGFPEEREKTTIKRQ